MIAATRSQARSGLGFGIVALAIALALPGAARADFGACSSAQAQPTECETLTVPLDRGGAVPGQVHLLVERRRAPEPRQGALLVLAGGPGQAATPLIDALQHGLAPALAARDLVVFDQRGTGASDRLNCPAIDAAGNQSELDRAVAGCAATLGPRRGFYTSRDSADDIDAVRRSLGLDKVSLYGVSYGTFTAMSYARRYPGHVESLVLDSVVNPGGRDPLDRSTHAAYRRVLRDVCSGRCGGITKNPVAELGRVVALARAGRLRAVAFGSTGRKVHRRISEADLVNLLAGADFDPTARAEIPAALVSARRGDGAPLLRVLLRERSVSGTRGAQAAAGTADSQALAFATACEEMALPWSRTAPVSTHRAQLASAISAVPPAVYAPFTRRVELAGGTGRQCFGWPDASPLSPLVTGPLPNVPALLLEGADDTRTPLADAQAARSLLPQATLVTVPETGHSVLGTDLTGCSSTALNQFFSGTAVTPCGPKPRLFPPTAVLPFSIGGLRAPRGLGGLRGRTVTAVAVTLADTLRQTVFRGLTGLQPSGGGLRGGRFRGALVGSALTIHMAGVVVVPGVTVNGTIHADLATMATPSADIRVGGRAASSGSLHFRNGSFRGRLGGHAVRSASGASVAAFRSRLPLRGMRNWPQITRRLSMLRPLALGAP